ncbi:MAG: hypothetical protein L3K07_08745, partial [Thermoplasmata archaeon]|nr:hypothetical protein [Thermoplasmata archaeon]
MDDVNYVLAARDSGILDPTGDDKSGGPSTIHDGDHGLAGNGGLDRTIWRQDELDFLEVPASSRR